MVAQPNGGLYANTLAHFLQVQQQQQILAALQQQAILQALVQQQQQQQQVAAGGVDQAGTAQSQTANAASTTSPTVQTGGNRNATAAQPLVAQLNQLQQLQQLNQLQQTLQQTPQPQTTQQIFATPSGQLIAITAPAPQPALPPAQPACQLIQLPNGQIVNIATAGHQLAPQQTIQIATQVCRIYEPRMGKVDGKRRMTRELYADDEQSITAADESSIRKPPSRNAIGMEGWRRNILCP